MNRSLAQQMRNGECDTPSQQEQEAFWNWVETEFNDTAITNDAECVCNLGE